MDVVKIKDEHKTYYLFWYKGVPVSYGMDEMTLKFQLDHRDMFDKYPMILRSGGTNPELNEGTIFDSSRKDPYGNPMDKETVLDVYCRCVQNYNVYFPEYKVGNCHIAKRRVGRVSGKNFLEACTQLLPNYFAMDEDENFILDKQGRPVFAGLVLESQ